MNGLLVCVSLLIGFIAFSMFLGVVKEHIIEHKKHYQGHKVNKYEK